eukprot:IDg632t1
MPLRRDGQQETHRVSVRGEDRELLWIVVQPDSQCVFCERDSGLVVLPRAEIVIFVCKRDDGFPCPSMPGQAGGGHRLERTEGLARVHILFVGSPPRCCFGRPPRLA